MSSSPLLTPKRTGLDLDQPAGRTPNRNLNYLGRTQETGLSDRIGCFLQGQKEEIRCRDGTGFPEYLSSRPAVLYVVLNNGKQRLCWREKENVVESKHFFKIPTPS